jgi:hypothetical protein
MASAVVQVCTDYRLNHELIRIQVRQRAERNGISLNRVYLVNEIGGNPGENFGHTVELLTRVAEPVVFCAVLHHDDCVAAQQGLRLDLPLAAQRLEAELARLKVACPVVTGEISTTSNVVRWTDEPKVQYRPFTFGPGWS